MAEAIALGASVIAVVQLADRVASLCKGYIDGVRDYPKDLRVIYVEISSLKAIFEGLTFLDKDNAADLATLLSLRGEKGPIHGCEAAIKELESLFPPGHQWETSGQKGKRQKLKWTLDRLAWPLKENKARRLLAELAQFKATVNVAFSGEIL